MERPIWLDDEPEIVSLLGQFLTRLDSRQAKDKTWKEPVRVTLSKSQQPNLYRNDEVADQEWMLIKSLETLIYKIVPDRKRDYLDPEYIGATLTLLDDGEVLLRDWLKRPMIVPYSKQWRTSVVASEHCFSGTIDTLLSSNARLPTKTAQQMVDAFVQIGQFCTDKLTLRQLSARCFWGNSKFLDYREPLLNVLYPDLVITPRPILIHIHLPQEINGVLLIENQDTYLRAISGKPNALADLAVVYTGGFKGAAHRVRNSSGSSLHFDDGCYGGEKIPFSQWWHSQGTADWPIWFWGDLDFSGMAILKLLRQNFPAIQAWPPGYRLMLDLLQQGQGHAPELAGKEKQIDPEITGCAYADGQLLPAMRKHTAFIDQEVL